MDILSNIKLRSGNSMPILGLGTWQLNGDTVEAVAHALENGYRMIDTSSDYGTQPDVGKAMKQSGVHHNSVFLVTKVEENDDPYESTKQNLEELQLDYIDLLLIHRPPETGAGENLWQGLIKARQDGLARDIGVSNYSEEQIQAIIENSGETPVVNQIEWSPFGHSKKMLEFCEQQNIIIQAYSPLTRGEKLDNTMLRDIAARHGKTPAQVVIRWNLQLGTVPIVKANRPEHQKENLQVFDFQLNGDEMDELSNLNEYYSSLGDSLIYV